MNICREYKNYFFDIQTYSNLDFRREICRYIRLNHPKGFNNLWWVVASILDPSLNIKSKNIFLKNRMYEPGITLLDIYHNYLGDVVKVILTSPHNYLKLFEVTGDIKNFENICRDILKKADLNQIRKSINYSKNIKEDVEFDYFENFNNSKKGKKLVFKRVLVAPDYVNNIHIVEVSGKVRNCIKEMRNQNRRKVFQRLLEGENTKQISLSLGMPQNTIYSHVHKGKREIKTFLEKDSLVA
jgi:DNA-directed RNA polymerase specialized sigma24 family protein